MPKMTGNPKGTSMKTAPINGGKMGSIPLSAPEWSGNKVPQPGKSPLKKARDANGDLVRTSGKNALGGVKKKKKMSTLSENQMAKKSY